MRTLAALAVLAGLGGALGAAAATGGATKPKNGLYGHVTKGPLTPVCSATRPCDGPATSTRVGFVVPGHAVHWTRTDGDGDYRIALPPGRYRIKSKVGFGVVHPPAVRVKSGGYARKDLMLDTGIR